MAYKMAFLININKCWSKAGRQTCEVIKLAAEQNFKKISFPFFLLIFNDREIVFFLDFRQGEMSDSEWNPSLPKLRSERLNCKSNLKRTQGVGWPNNPRNSFRQGEMSDSEWNPSHSKFYYFYHDIIYLWTSIKNITKYLNW